MFVPSRAAPQAESPRSIVLVDYRLEAPATKMLARRVAQKKVRPAAIAPSGEHVVQRKPPLQLDRAAT